MAKKTAPLLPATEALLHQFGERLRLARLRRGLSAKQVCERAGMTPMTLRSLERGGAGVTIGAYLAVMHSLGIEQELQTLAQADALGRALQDARLPPPRARSKPCINAAVGVVEQVDSQVPGSTEAARLTNTPLFEAVQLTAQHSAKNWQDSGAFIHSDMLANLLVPRLPTKRKA
jgi:transcriptional regulator with XRE-family HTH domain